MLTVSGQVACRLMQTHEGWESSAALLGSLSQLSKAGGPAQMALALYQFYHILGSTLSGMIAY